MHRPIGAIIAASLLLLSGNAAAVMINDQFYGNSGYSLNDIDAAIQAFQDDVSGRKDRRRLKKAIRLDRNIERLAFRVDSAILSNNDRKHRRKNNKLKRKETKLLAILAGYLPNLDELLQNGNMPMISNILLSTDIQPPPPGTLPSEQDLVTAPVAGPGTVTTFGTPPSEITSVPEPSMLALLSLGFAGLIFTGRRRRL